MLASSFLDDTLQALTIDVMVLETNAVLWISVDGSQSPFDSTGHYPILAGNNELGRALFICAVRVEQCYHFTCLEDGASSVRYTDEIGDTHITEKFLVLALRYDPSDRTPPYPQRHSRAMDPTGPLHWLRFWPETDPDYVAPSELARVDDGHFVSILAPFSPGVGGEKFGRNEQSLVPTL